MDEAYALETWKSWTIEATFSKLETKKIIKFDFLVKFHKPITNN